MVYKKTTEIHVGCVHEIPLPQYKNTSLQKKSLHLVWIQMYIYLLPICIIIPFHESHYIGYRHILCYLYIMLAYTYSGICYIIFIATRYETCLLNSANGIFKFRVELSQKCNHQSRLNFYLYKLITCRSGKIWYIQYSISLVILSD